MANIDEILEDIDDGLKETISILNKKGYTTFGCCEGHWHEGTNGYWHAYIAFRSGCFPREPRLTGFKHANLCNELYTTTEESEVVSENSMKYELSPARNDLFIRFSFKNIDMTREEKDRAHSAFLEELLEWAKQLEQKDEEKCLRREEWLKKRIGYFDYDTNPEWNSYMEVPETDLDLEKEWNDKWSKLIDADSLKYFDGFKHGRFDNGYSLLLQIFKESGNVQNYFFSDVEGLKDYLNENKNLIGENDEGYIEIVFKNHFVSDIQYDPSEMDDLAYLYLYKALAYGNDIILSKYDELHIQIRFDIVTDSEILNGEIYQWWFWESDMDFSARDSKYGEFDMGPFLDYYEVMEKINADIDSMWQENSKAIICNVKLDYTDEFVQIPVSFGVKKHVDYDTFKNILFTSFTLMDENEYVGNLVD